MKKIIFLILTVLFTLQSQAQQESIELLKKQLVTIQTEEKAALKKQVENINSMLENGVITSEKANRLKTKAAEATAEKIDERQSVVKETITYLEKKGTNQKNIDSDREFFLDIDSYFNGDSETPKYVPKQDSVKSKPVVEEDQSQDTLVEGELTVPTKLDLVAAFGYTNAVAHGNWEELQEERDYSLYSSYFLEFGLALKTPLVKENGIRLKYGISYQFNKLQPNNNRYFAEVDGQIQLQRGNGITASGFNMHNLVMPIHLEFGPTKKKQDKNNTYYFSASNQLKFAVGAYVGLNLRSNQWIERPYYHNGFYWIGREEMHGYDLNKIYGISAYAGIGAFSIYGKYDLNTIFANSANNQQLISLGLRLDL